MGGNALWSETVILRTGPDGLFTYHLGGINPIPDSVFSDTSRWLGIQIDSDPEMLPRQRFSSVPFSFVVGAGASGGGSFLPLAGGTMTGPITSSGDPAITMGRGNFGMLNTNVGAHAFVAGQNNAAAGDLSNVSGGAFNSAMNTGSAVGGGRRNLASGDYAVISGGGGLNPSDSNIASGTQSSIGGGKGNRASGDQSTVAGGSLNQAADLFSTVAGGLNNQATGNSAFVGSGQANTASGFLAVVAGGSSNTAAGQYSSVTGGQSNNASGQAAVIGGGQTNSAGGLRTVIGGGVDNTTTGIATTVPGGSLNEAHGSYSFAAGHRAKANHSGSFVWADTVSSDFESTADNQFLIRASGGVGIGTETPLNRLDVHGAIAVGLSYAGNQVAPNGGLIVEGWTGLGTVSPHSKLHVNGAMATSTLTFAGDVSLNEAHSVVLVDASGGTRTVRLPSAAGIAGRQYTIKKVDALNFGVIIDPASTQRIDGATTHTLIGQWRYVVIVSDGANWMIVGNN